MSKPKQTLSPSQALKRYRRHSPPDAMEHVRDFNKMGINDRIELLFFMVVHGAHQLAEVSEVSGVAVPELPVESEH